MARRTPPVHTGDSIELAIDSLAVGGAGVARHEGFVVMVRRGLPGDTVRARIGRVRRSFAEAVVEEVLVPAPQRVAAPCPFHQTCGGCAWQALAYPAQLAAKEQEIREVLQRIGGLDEVPLEPIIGADEVFGYRNKVEYSFTALDDDGGVDAGYHALGRWDQIVPVSPCLIADPRGRIVRDVVVAWANRYTLSAHNRATGEGLLRHLVVRVGRATGELLVHVVTSEGKLPRAAELVDDIRAEVPGVVGVLHSESTSSAEVARGDSAPTVLWGEGTFREQLAGNVLTVGAGSFLQTNTAMAERAYALVREFAELRSDDIAYDLYCGLGSITLMLAREVDHVVGVEVVEEAIHAARANAAANGISNVEFQHGNVRPVLKFAAGVWPDPTLVVVDPPRSGLVEKVVRRICERAPERIVYVSCNPATFAADVVRFRDHGYGLTKARPVDQFPHTPHVELVARFDPLALADSGGDSSIER